MTIHRAVSLVFATLFLVTALAGAKKKNPDDDTQVLDLPKDPPAVAIGETRRLVFHVSPLSAKGLLSQQTRDALRAILKANGGMPIVHIRAFVGGSGDLRRVPQIVSEIMTEKKLPLPSVSLVQAGALGLEGAQVALEAVSLAKKDVNPDGLGFVAATPDAMAASATASAPAASVLQISCFVGVNTGLAPIAATLAAKFPSAAVNVVQALRGPVGSESTCEAVTRGGTIKSEKLAFSGTRIAIGADQKAAATAFQRLDKDLADAGAGQGSAVATHIYAVTARIGEMAKAARGAQGGAVVMVPFEGVASVDAAFAVDAVSAVK